jgi:hypothetical protein
MLNPAVTMNFRCHVMSVGTYVQPLADRAPNALSFP